MATYAELNNILQDSSLRNRLRVAAIIAADTISKEDPATVKHAERLVWAKQAFANPDGKAVELINAVIAANNGVTTANILSVSDAVIQTNVDAVIDVFADGS